MAGEGRGGGKGRIFVWVEEGRGTNEKAVTPGNKPSKVRSYLSFFIQKINMVPWP